VVSYWTRKSISHPHVIHHPPLCSGGCWLTGWGHAVSCSRPNPKLWWNGNEQTKGPDFKLWSLMVCFPVEEFGVLKFGSLWPRVQNVGGYVWCKSLCLPSKVPSNPDKAVRHLEKTSRSSLVLFSFSSFCQRKSSKWSVGYITWPMLRLMCLSLTRRTSKILHW